MIRGEKEKKMGSFFYSSNKPHLIHFFKKKEIIF